MTSDEKIVLIAQMAKYRREHFQGGVRTSTDSVRAGYPETVYIEWSTNGSQWSAGAFTPEEAKLMHAALGAYLETNKPQTFQTKSL